MSDTITQGVHIHVETEYLEEQSAPEKGQFFFTYHITIHNSSDQTVQLLSRHWIITNADGHEQEVKGPGVIGEQPTLAPGEHFNYSSFCPLDSPVGTMHGSYQMVTETGDCFDAAISPFSLQVPGLLQ